MNLSKKISLTLALGSAFVIYSSKTLADHGSLGFGIGTASPIITQSGVTLPEGRWAGGVLTQFISFRSAPDSTLLTIKNGAVDEAHGDIHSIQTFLQPALFAAYGLTDDMTLGIRLPYVLRSGNRTPNEEGTAVNNQGSSNGFGDVSLFGQYRFYHSADNLNHASVVIGLKTPTGRTHVTDAQGQRFETHTEPGGGSWDPSLGFSFTRAMGDFSFDTSYLYTFTNGGTQRTNLGDLFSYNFAISYAFGAPVRNNFFASSNNAPWTAVLELNGEWQDFQTFSGVRDPNSNSHIVYVSPGIRFSGGKNWNTALSIGAPIITDHGGFETVPDYRITYRFVGTF